MGRMKKKFTSGEATQYLSKRAAERDLQISDRDFQRLVILTGTHPVEPKHKKRVGKGSTFPRTYFFKKDVQHVGRNPIIDLLRKKRVYFRKLSRAHERKDAGAIERLEANIPDETYYIDNIIYERYPTPLDALNDLDDCLNFIFMFSRLPSISGVASEKIDLCRTLAMEFLNYVIVTRSVKNAYSSIKGFYFQAEIHNVSVIWMMPIDLVHKAPTNIEFGLFKSFCDLYIRILEFIMVWLYKEKNLYYPPKLVKLDLKQGDTFELIASLNQPLGYKSLTSHDTAGGLLEGGDYAAAEEKMLKTHLDMQRTDDDAVDDSQGRAAQERLRNLAKSRLFSNVKVFLGRETPRQPLCIIIRSCGGLVSWPETCGPGCTFPQDDTEIQYEVVDRPMKADSMRLDRKYVQPQWVFDSLNAGQLLPVGQYAPGVRPPSHLSPFVPRDLPSDDEEEEDLEDEFEEEVEDKESNEDSGAEEDEDNEEEDEDNEEEDEDDDEEDSSEEEMEVEEPKAKKSKVLKKSPGAPPKTKKATPQPPKKRQGSIAPGRLPSDREVKNKENKKQNEQRRLREAMLPKRHRELYKKMCHSVKRSNKDLEKLKEKKRKAKQRK